MRREYENVMRYSDMLGLSFTVSWKVHIGKDTLVSMKNICPCLCVCFDIY